LLQFIEINNNKLCIIGNTTAPPHQFYFITFLISVLKIQNISQIGNDKIFNPKYLNPNIKSRVK
jgi:hypothetical protein